MSLNFEKGRSLSQIRLLQDKAQACEAQWRESLVERDQAILRAIEAKTLDGAEIGRELGVSRQRIVQIKQRAELTENPAN